MRSRAPCALLVVAVVASLLGGCGRTGLREPGSFWIEAMEATQGVQVTHLVPLIANKRTFVRVTVRGDPDSAGPPFMASAALTVEGNPTEPHPLNAETLTVPRAGDRTGGSATVWDLTDSFVFELPGEAITAGERRVHAVLRLPDGRPAPTSARGSTERDLSLRFGPTGDPVSLHVYRVRYEYVNVPENATAYQRYGSARYLSRSQRAVAFTAAAVDRPGRRA